MKHSAGKILSTFAKKKRINASMQLNGDVLSPMFFFAKCGHYLPHKFTRRVRLYWRGKTSAAGSCR